MPKDRFVLLQASEEISANKIRLAGSSREELLNAKLAIELAKKFDNNYTFLSEQQLNILEKYLLSELEKINPKKPQEGFEFVYQNVLHFYLRLKNYDKVIDYYKILLRLINENDLDIDMDCAILVTIAYIKTNRLDIAKRNYNYVLNDLEKKGIELKNTAEILFNDLFKEHNIDVKILFS